MIGTLNIWNALLSVGVFWNESNRMRIRRNTRSTCSDSQSMLQLRLQTELKPIAQKTNASEWNQAVGPIHPQTSGLLWQTSAPPYTFLDRPQTCSSKTFPLSFARVSIRRRPCGRTGPQQNDDMCRCPRQRLGAATTGKELPSDCHSVAMLLLLLILLLLLLYY